MFHTCDGDFEEEEDQNLGNPGRFDVGKLAERNSKREIEEAAEFLKAQIEDLPKIAVICGSGLGCFPDLLEDKTEFPYATIPHFPTCTVQGHDGKLIFGKLNEIPLLCMKGRFHLYEGYPLWKCTLPVRIMKNLGVEFLVTTNAAGGINRKFKNGDVMIIEDHIDLVRLFGNFSLRGPPNNLFKFAYAPMNRFYDERHVEKCVKIGELAGLRGNIHRGVYVFAAGPNFESVADVKLLQVMGGDAVGSSTVHEVIVAKNCGIEVIAFSLITNMCIANYDNDEEVSHDDVLGVGYNSGDVLNDFLKKIVEYIHEIKANQN